MYFALFDGHGSGAGCAEFMGDNLHKKIAQSAQFPADIKASLKEGF